MDPKAEIMHQVARVKPLLRGWFHAFAAPGAAILTVVLVVICWGDWPKLISMLVFGLSTLLLYTVSAIYHIPHWNARWHRFWQSFDHANIFALIAGTYTAICFNVLSGWLRVAILSTIWALALSGFVLALFTDRLPRWFRTSLYVGMGWVGIVALPALVEALPMPAIVTMFVGGLLYSAGALVYGKRWPDPFPHVFGFHEIFHLFVIAAGIVFAISIMLWAVPYARP